MSTEPLPEPVKPPDPLPEPELNPAPREPQPLRLPPPMTQTELRQWAFAKRVCETADVGEAYRDVFAPGDELAPYHHARGGALLKNADVGKIISNIAAPALVELGVDKNHVIKRLLETVDSDLTDYHDQETGEIMDGLALRKLPFEKRRLVRKIKEKYHAITGKLIAREIELEPKHAAMQLLSQIQQWVKPAGDTYINHENIVTFMTLAQKDATRRADELRASAAASGTAKQMNRPIIEGAFKQLPTQVPASGANQAPAVVPSPELSPPPPVRAVPPAPKPEMPAKPVDKLAGYRAPSRAEAEQSGIMEDD